MIEIHLFSLGRNEGRGVRIKIPVTSQAELEPAISAMLAGYQPGRDQNAVSPIVRADTIDPGRVFRGSRWNRDARGSGAAGAD